MHWVASGDASLFTALHRPADAPHRDLAVILCPPLGHEQVHGYRSLRRLADDLAVAGCATARFDLSGTGNSSGSIDRGDMLARWRDDIAAQADWLRRHLGIRNIALVGYRFGATLAAMADVDSVCRVFWAPYRSGRKYARELKALSLLSDYPQTRDDVIECAGFEFPDALLAAIGSAAPAVDAPRTPGLLIGPDAKALDAFEGVLDAPQRVPQDEDEFEQSMLEPHYAKLPQDSIDAIVRYVTTADAGGPMSAVAAPDLCTTATHGSVREALLSCDAPGVFGVLTGPASDDPPPFIVVLPNAGSVHTMGPNRIYVELTRALAAAGITSFRFDLPTLGDSVIGAVAAENHPYPHNTVETTGAVTEFLAAHCDTGHFVLAGLCSGSYTAFRYVLARGGSPDLHLAMINPLTFYWEDGMKLRLGAGQAALGNAKYYDRAMFDPASWKRFFQGKTKFRAVFAFLWRRMVDCVKQWSRLAADALRLSKPTRLATELQTIVDGGSRISMFIGARDIGYELLRQEALSAVGKLERQGHLRATFIADGDHTFSHAAERRNFVDAFVRFAKDLRF